MSHPLSSRPTLKDVARLAGVSHTTVALGTLKHGSHIHTVVMDYFHGANSGCELLLERGCRRIGFAIPPYIETRSGNRWLGGHMAGTYSSGNPPLIYEWPKTGVPLKDSLQAWAKEHRLDAVLTVNREVYDALEPLGIRIFFLNETECGPGTPRYIFDFRTIGSEGMRFLHNLLLLRDYGLPQKATVVSLRGEWKDD